MHNIYMYTYIYNKYIYFTCVYIYIYIYININIQRERERERGMDRKEILNSPPDKFLISVHKICLYVTPPTSGSYRI